MARVQDRCKLLRESDFEMMTACATRFEFVCLAEISFALVHSGAHKWEETVASRPLVPLCTFCYQIEKKKESSRRCWDCHPTADANGRLTALGSST